MSPANGSLVAKLITETQKAKPPFWVGLPGSGPERPRKARASAKPDGWDVSSGFARREGLYVLRLSFLKRARPP
jgi:hypothetical protein